MNVRSLCLAMLSMGEASGYEIKTQSVEGDWSHFVDASFGSIYSALKALEEEGLVTSRQEGDPGRPPRKVYAITPAGEEELTAAFSELPGEDKFKSSFLMHVIFADRLGERHLTTILDRRIAEYERRLANIHRMMETFDAPGPQWAGGLGLACMTAELDYMRSKRDDLIACGRDDALPLAAE